MTQLPVNQLEIGHVVATDIVTAHGQVIVEGGTKIDGGVISKLRFYGVHEIFVEDPPGAAPAPAPAPAPTADQQNDAATYSQRTKESSAFSAFQQAYNRNLSLLEEAYHNVIDENFQALDFVAMLRELSTLFGDKTTLDLLNYIHTLDGTDSIYASNINVAIVSRGIGRWAKFPKEILDIITLAGLFHDVGKLLVPDEILFKTTKLDETEFLMLKQHTVYGAEALAKVPGLNPLVVNAAVQHHEKNDGTGYPYGLKGDEIDECASIIAIADVYEGMTALRSYRKPLSAFQVIANFENEGLQKYSPKYMPLFLNRVASAHQNRMVVLNDGRKARVIFLNSGKLSSPMVELEDKTVIDLSRTPDLYITEVL